MAAAAQRPHLKPVPYKSVSAITLDVQGGIIRIGFMDVATAMSCTWQPPEGIAVVDTNGTTAVRLGRLTERLGFSLGRGQQPEP